MAADPALPWIAESETFCAGDRKALSAWSERLLTAAREALERDGATPEMLGSPDYVAWVAIDTFIAGLNLDRLAASTLSARLMLKTALSIGTDAANSNGAVVSPARAAQALAGLQLTAAHGLQLALNRGDRLGARH